MNASKELREQKIGTKGVEGVLVERTFNNKLVEAVVIFHMNIVKTGGLDFDQGNVHMDSFLGSLRTFFKVSFKKVLHWCNIQDELKE